MTRTDTASASAAPTPTLWFAAPRPTAERAAGEVPRADDRAGAAGVEVQWPGEYPELREQGPKGAPTWLFHEHATPPKPEPPMYRGTTDGSAPSEGH